MRKRLIGITGGIGSGKSVVSRILRNKGFVVYDCDSQAKHLMNDNERIKQRISKEISSEVTDGFRAPDRKLLAEIVFNDNAKRLLLNEIVHGAVRENIKHQIDSLGDSLFFVEAAVLAESGLANECDSIWMVSASENERIERIKTRDGFDIDTVKSRMISQKGELELMKEFACKTRIIQNNNLHSLLFQIDVLLDEEMN